jgi:hypothetical protein
LAVTFHGSELFALPASTHAPQVHVLWPNGGETLPAPGPYSITWQGSDLDGDLLTYLVEYSADGGQTWVALGDAVGETSLAVPAGAGAMDPSRQALIRVTASDGLRTATDVSDTIFSAGLWDTYLPVIDR